jgi:hypothetical protein
MDRLAVGAYLSHAVTLLKNAGKLKPDVHPVDQVTPFADLPDVEQASWIAAVQSVLSNGGAAFAMRNPADVAMDLGEIAVDEIVNQWPIRQMPGEIRFPSTADQDAMQMWARVTARVLGSAKITVPAAIAKGELLLTITKGPGGCVKLPDGLYKALLASGFKEGEAVTIAIMDPSWNRDVPESMLEKQGGDFH